MRRHLLLVLLFLEQFPDPQLAKNAVSWIEQSLTANQQLEHAKAHRSALPQNVIQPLELL